MQINIYDYSISEKIVSGNLVKVIYVESEKSLNIFIKNAGFSDNEIVYCSADDCVHS